MSVAGGVHPPPRGRLPSPRQPAMVRGTAAAAAAAPRTVAELLARYPPPQLPPGPHAPLGRPRPRWDRDQAEDPSGESDGSDQALSTPLASPRVAEPPAPLASWSDDDDDDADGNWIQAALQWQRARAAHRTAPVAIPSPPGQPREQRDDDAPYSSRQSPQGTAPWPLRQRTGSLLTQRPPAVSGNPANGGTPSSERSATVTAQTSDEEVLSTHYQAPDFDFVRDLEDPGYFDRMLCAVGSPRDRSPRAPCSAPDPEGRRWHMAMGRAFQRLYRVSRTGGSPNRRK